MKKKLLILFFSLVFSVFAHAQYRISLDSTNTYKYELSYSIDVPYNMSIKNLYIDNTYGLIPAEIVFSTKNRIWYNTDTLVVLEKNRTEKNNPISDEIDFTKYIIPKHGATIKSTGRPGSFSKHKLLSNNIKDNPDSVLIYYSEGNVPIWRPEDSIYRTQPGINTYIKQFQDRNKVTIGKAYSKAVGFEGEGILYFTLDGLTPAQKIDFIDTRIYQRIPHKELMKIKRTSSIYMPFVISKKYLRAVNYWR